MKTQISFSLAGLTPGDHPLARNRPSVSEDRSCGGRHVGITRPKVAAAAPALLGRAAVNRQRFLSTPSSLLFFLQRSEVSFTQTS